MNRICPLIISVADWMATAVSSLAGEQKVRSAIREEEKYRGRSVGQGASPISLRLVD